MQERRASGGRGRSSQPSDRDFADAIAEHLGIFDEVHGSDSKLNLKGEREGQFLAECFGSKGIAYLGDAKADLPVWSRAAKAINVYAPAALRREAERACESVEHLVTDAKSIKPYIKALPPHQWLKNSLVFLPMLAAHQLDSQTCLISDSSFQNGGLNERRTVCFDR